MKLIFGCQSVNLYMKSLKIDRRPPINMSIVLMKFEVDIKDWTIAGVWKPKYPIWPPGGPFASDIA